MGGLYLVSHSVIYCKTEFYPSPIYRHVCSSSRVICLEIGLLRERFQGSLSLEKLVQLLF